jgi:hypothetical protein
MPREQARSVIGFADVPGAATGEDQRSLLRSAHEEGDAEKMMRITKVADGSSRAPASRTAPRYPLLARDKPHRRRDAYGCALCRSRTGWTRSTMSASLLGTATSASTSR